MKVKAMQNKIQLKLKEERTKFIKQVSKLDTLSPLKTLARGYSIVTDSSNKIIKSVKDLKENQNINIRLADGEKQAKVL